jgi:fatty acid-binding protein DegV
MQIHLLETSRRISGGSRITHANNMEEALSLELSNKEMSPSVRTEIMTFVPMVGAHMGEGTLALSWINRTALKSIAVQDLVLEPVLKG